MLHSLSGLLVGSKHWCARKPSLQALVAPGSESSLLWRPRGADCFPRVCRPVHLPHVVIALPCLHTPPQPRFDRASALTWLRHAET